MLPPDSTVIIATHSLVYGAPQALKDYLEKAHAGAFYFISHSLIDADTPSTLTRHHAGQATLLAEVRNRCRSQLPKTFIEMLRNIRWGMGAIRREIPRGKRRIYIGVNPINALSGLVLRALGLVDKVVFYTIDYVPRRHPNAVVNAIYHRIDRICYFGADAVWNVSSRINEGRLSSGGYKTVAHAHAHVVPIGVWLAKEQENDTPRVRGRLVFIGHLLEKQGVQYVLPAMPIIRKAVPEAHLVVIGGGEYEEALRGQAAALGVTDCVRFTGWVRDRHATETMLREGEVALAPYVAELDTFTYYADPTKLKDYLLAGLPILTTDLPHNARDIEANGCGKVVSLSPESIAQAAIALFADRDNLTRMSKNAKQYIEQFTWESIFSKALKESSL